MFDKDKTLASWRKYSKTPKGRYQDHKRSAKQRGIPWEFTFEEWWNYWQQDDAWNNKKLSNLVMARIGDKGAYSPTNVYITTRGNNVRDAWINGVFLLRPKNNRNSFGQFIRKVG